MGLQLTGRSRQIMRLLLEIDKPITPLSNEELEAQARQDYRWNFTMNLLDGAFFWFSLSFISATTILPLFISKLTTAPVWFALLAVLSQAAWYLPQLFAAGPTERLSRKKPVVINIGFITERLPIWLLPVSAMLTVVNPVLALILFFVAYAWHGFGAGAIAPAWSDMIARMFPVDRRGWFFGLSSFVGTGLGAFGALVSGWMLIAFPYPQNFAYTFLVAAISMTVSWAFLAFAREPVQAVPKAAVQRGDQSWQKIKAIVRRDHNFRNFLGARFLANLGRMGAGFLTVAALQRWAVSDATVGLYTAALLIGQTVGNLLAGVIADRRGHKFTLELAQAAGVLTFLLAWLAPSPVWFYGVFFLMGMANGISIVSGVLSVMEFSAPEHRPSYIGIGNTVSGIGSAIAPIIGGVLAVYSYNALFAVSAAISVAGWVALSVGLRDPRQHGHADALREASAEP
ncbi:MAG: MFS transporter [Caldilinea sp.]|nr:MFS transporter [Caldilinea sp.]MCB0059161.1 MFS transporter [Caldilineaceae bacterium]MCO5208220.1 MFS transporter [Caldilinea sp.]MCW5845265.1 MFS transporter [Caldilinea sp.]